MASVLDCGAKGRFVEVHSGDRLLTTQQPSLRETNLSREANTTGDGWALLSTYRVLDIAIKAVSLCDPLPLTFFFKLMIMAEQRLMKSAGRAKMRFLNRNCVTWTTTEGLGDASWDFEQELDIGKKKRHILFKETTPPSLHPHTKNTQT